MKYLKFGTITLLGLLLVLVSGCTPEQENPVDLIQEVNASAKAGMQFNFTTALKGLNEVPPVATRATGLAKVTISKDGTYLSYRINVANIEDVLFAHFHMAPTGENGGVVATLFFSDPPAEDPNGVLVKGIITADDVSGQIEGDFDALVNAIRNGNIYINVHSLAVPSGELRGQL
ncbi:MAG: CHRD domain-containing protein [Gramella sp.]|nr:CHRD domain-containing protein [Christiangramia sp.]